VYVERIRQFGPIVEDVTVVGALLWTAYANVCVGSKDARGRLGFHTETTRPSGS